MLEARMVAARIQRPRAFEHGAVAGPDRITFSSQGFLETCPHICGVMIVQAAFAELKISKARARLALLFSTRRDGNVILNPNTSRLASHSGSDALMSIRIVEADLKLPEHREGVLAMVDAYSMDAMGSGKPLDRDVRARLISGLQRHPTTLIFLAFEGEQPVGVAVCFIGFSTFAAEPLVNIHDCMVLPAFRGKSVGRRLLEAVEGKARELGCCKLTLEVMDNNHRALRAYEAAGFVRYSLQKDAGRAIFLSKPLH